MTVDGDPLELSRDANNFEKRAHLKRVSRPIRHLCCNPISGWFINIFKKFKQHFIFKPKIDCILYQKCTEMSQFIVLELHVKKHRLLLLKQ
jgi:hypothetical protein